MRANSPTSWDVKTPAAIYERMAALGWSALNRRYV